MFKKIFNKIKENKKDIIILIALLLLFSIKFPYYIDSPGGTMSLNDRFDIENANKINGDISLVYVAERPATIPTLLLSLVLKDCDIIKKDEVVYNNETDEEIEARGRLTLDQGINSAILYAFKKTGKEYEILSTKIYVMYKAEYAKTDLKVGDQIIQVDDLKIETGSEIADYINTLEVGTKVKIKVISNNKEKTREAEIVDDKGAKRLGIYSTPIYEYKLSQDVKYKKNNSEMGSSGGFANALYIYSSLIEEDIIKGRLIVGTGTIDIDGNIGEIGGLKYKFKAAAKAGASVFFVPEGNCEEAKKIKNEKNYDLNFVCIKTFDEAIDYLKK